ncbi:hypothetical protein I79_024833 [Cricetulus griseus]|uniref:Uncharacterized protein n=1 Tax=Cricetulus griseus TaxID=10029 RepID=G3ILR2_CRIGR|nr:hypothetical protein I79_024833 [Cricetulus griseus]
MVSSRVASWSQLETLLLWSCPWATGTMFTPNESADRPSLRAERRAEAWSSSGSCP